MGLLVSCWLGFAGLFWWAATLHRHERTLGGGPLSETTRRMLRLGGSALLVAAPWPWMLTYDPAMALTAWLFCTLPVAGAAVVLTLAYAPRAGALVSGLHPLLR